MFVPRGKKCKKILAQLEGKNTTRIEVITL
jgi:hypothetical protein